MEQTINRNKQTAINIISSLIAYGVNLGINFFLSPYIVRTVGVEANGFISLANSFTSYAALATMALNTMAGCFITIEYHQGNIKQANKYYSSVFFGDIVIVGVLSVPSIILIARLEQLLDIPATLVWDVKLLFVFLFVNFFISIILSNMSSALFIKNKIYLQSLRQIEVNLIKIGVIGIGFIFLSPKVYYVGLSALVSGIYAYVYNFRYKIKLIPDIRVKKEYFDISAIKNLLKSGIWNSITQAGTMLLSGFDLLIANLFFDSTVMGVLALAKTIPSVIANLSGTLVSTFTPSLTIDYANNDMEALKKNLKSGMKITGIILTIPLTILIVYGSEFYSLWQPTQDSKLLQLLSILTCFGFIFTSGIQCLNNIFLVVNKLKVNSILVLISGVLSTVTVLLLLKFTSLGVFSITIVSSVINLLRSLFYTVPYAAKYINCKWTTFYPEVITSVISTLLLSIIGYCMKYVFPCQSWLTLCISGIIMGGVGLIINLMIVLNKSERASFIGIIKKKLGK